MKKFSRVFVSQIFNSFFPVLIIAILIKLADNAISASVFLLLNFSNIYLLFSDYSSNTIFLKDALQSGGITKDFTQPKVIKDIQSYIGVKSIVLAAGFVVWISLCLFIPQLRHHALSNILAYTFIVGNNLNFYWLYMSSTKEYFFIISNFLGRIFFLVMLISFIVLKLDFFYLMPLTGLGVILISILIFKRFCTVYNLQVETSFKSIRKASAVVKRDWPFVANSFLIMTPTTCLSFFIGFIKNSTYVVVYAFAEKIFMAFRALLAVFVNSIFPVICSEGAVNTKKANRIFMLFYVTVGAGCALIYLLSPFIFSYFRLPANLNSLFNACMLYFLITIVVISINTRFFMRLLLTNQFNTTQNFVWLMFAALLVVAVFCLNTFTANTVVFIAQSVMVAEAVIVLAFIFLNYRTRTTPSR